MRPGTIEEAAESIAGLGRDGRSVRVAGARTKSGWSSEAADVTLETGELARILEHNTGDFTAVLEAGLPLAEAQDAFAQAGQMLAWDPPVYPGTGDRGGDQPSATVGGIVSTSDSGPSRHRYGGVRDTLIGITVILSDGTIARAGGKVIKNVAGYDLGKLFAGSFGTLGMIATVSVRLHPLPRQTATVIGSSAEPGRLASAAGELARRSLEADCLDLRWAQGSGQVLVRYSGALALRRAQETAAELALDEVQVLDADEPVWERQRSLQRSGAGAVLKISARPSELVAVLKAARDARATVAARAGLGLAWVAFEPGDDPPERLAARVAELRTALAPLVCTPLDGAARLGLEEPPISDGARVLMGRIKERLDPARCFPPAPGTVGATR